VSQVITPNERTTSTDRVQHDLVARARATLTRSHAARFWSSVGAGLAIAFSFLAAAAATAAAPEGWGPLAAAAAYPLGFVLVVGGRYQLFTENTLAPVARVLERLSSVPRLLSVWAVILVGNLVGAVAVGLFLAVPGVLPVRVHEAAPQVMSVVHEISMVSVFGRAMLAGWLVAAMVWLLHRMKKASPMLVVWSMTALMPLLQLEHIVVGSVEAVYTWRMGLREAWPLFAHLWMTLLGNIAGGVLLVTVINHARTTAAVPLRTRLTWREMWLSMRAQSADCDDEDVWPAPSRQLQP